VTRCLLSPRSVKLISVNGKIEETEVTADKLEVTVVGELVASIVVLLDLI
jgi:hypothetical protein